MPEFKWVGVLLLISALAASLYLLKWRKEVILPMPDGGSRMGVVDYIATLGYRRGITDYIEHTLRYRTP